MPFGTSKARAERYQPDESRSSTDYPKGHELMFHVAASKSCQPYLLEVRSYESKRFTSEPQVPANET